MKGCLYLLDAKLIQTSQEASHYSSSPKITWDQWHQRFGHISVTSLEHLSKDGMVSGLMINQSSKPSNSPYSHRLHLLKQNQCA